MDGQQSAAVVDYSGNAAPYVLGATFDWQSYSAS